MTEITVYAEKSLVKIIIDLVRFQFTLIEIIVAKTADSQSIK